MPLKTLLDFFLPPHCVVCENEIRDGLVCDDCLELVEEISPPLCSNCGYPLKKKRNCQYCDKIQNLTRIRAWGYYSPSLDKLIHEFKYNRRKSLSTLFGRKIAPILKSDPWYRNINLIVPIPIHPVKAKERGFNQSMLLAKSISNELGMPVGNRLKRVKNNRSQTGLTDSQRKKNIQGAFKLKESVEDLSILLIDDVVTTGSTIEEGAKVLKDGGAQSVLGAAVAIAPL